MKKLTIRDVQRRQSKIVPHEKVPPIYNEPIMRLGEMAPALWQLETLSEADDRHEKIKALVAACFLHLADYCNAKKWNLGQLVADALDKIEAMDEKETDTK